MYVAARGLCTRVTVVAFPDLTDAITMFSDVITVYWYIFKYIYIYIYNLKIQYLYLYI